MASMVRMAITSRRPPMKPDSSPTGTATTRVTLTTCNATRTATREPNMSLDATSRPRWSVPSQWSPDIPPERSPTKSSVGS